jgi:hypothetical protein
VKYLEKASVRKFYQRGFEESRVNKGLIEKSAEKSDLKLERSSAAKVSRSWMSESRKVSTKVLLCVS